MRSVALVLVPVAAALAVVMACEDNSSPDCRDDACTVVNEGGVPQDSALPNQTDDGATPDPFDAGVVDPNASCKGLFELCTGIECCSPYGCTNGTCR